MQGTCIFVLILVVALLNYYNFRGGNAVQFFARQMAIPNDYPRLVENLALSGKNAFFVLILATVLLNSDKSREGGGINFSNIRLKEDGHAT